VFLTHHILRLYSHYQISNGYTATIATAASLLLSYKTSKQNTSKPKHLYKVKTMTQIQVENLDCPNCGDRTQQFHSANRYSKLWQ
jgi:ribosomal protein S27AE